MHPSSLLPAPGALGQPPPPIGEGGGWVWAVALLLAARLGRVTAQEARLDVRQLQVGAAAEPVGAGRGGARAASVAGMQCWGAQRSLATVHLSAGQSTRLQF